MSSPGLDLQQALAVARHAAAAGAAAALPYWRSGIVAETKDDGSPVTAADRAAEAAILEVLRWHYPRHAILAEESGAHGQADLDQPTWLVDPLDGTLAFVRGSRFWGPLVAFAAGGEVLAAAVTLPALEDSLWAARGLGAWCNDERLRVSSVDDWAESALVLGSVGPLLNGPAGDGVLRLMRTSRRSYAPGDLGGPAFVLDGQAEAWLEQGAALWDLAPFKVLVEEAGGRCTDLAGGDDLASGGAVVSNGLLHDHVLAVLNEPGSAAGADPWFNSP